MVKRKDIASILFFLILSGILIFSWFRFGHMYGGGDTGLPTYNPIAAAKISSNIWYDSLAPGIPVGNALTVAPMLFMLSIPQALGASSVFIQALLFFILLFLMGYGMYLLALSIFGRTSFFLAISAGVFYLFNPYMMIQIWHRFIHNSMFFVAFLPFWVLTWLWWIRKRDLKFLLLFLGINFLAVYIYGTIAFIVAIWALLFFITLLESLIPWKDKKAFLKLFTAFLIGLFFWLLTNSWWLISTFSVSPALFATQHTTDDSLTTLMMLSSQTILPFTLRLINPFYLYWQADFGSIYQNIFFVSISWLFVVVVLIGFLRGLRQKAYAIWSLLFLILIFLGKGAAAPFSFPYIFGFANFFPLGVIRNPFEKLGILLPFIYAILFALGLQFLLTTGVKYIGKSKTYLLLIIFILLHMAFFWPMFAGKLFGTLDKQNFVSVPKSYTEANEWIKQDIKTTSVEGRILHLPLPRSEGVTYNWQYGYHGVEPSAAIFTSLPSIARGLDIPRVSDALSGLSLIFHKPYASNQGVILKMLQDFNIKYIILHKDIEWLGGYLYNPKETEEVLDKLKFLTKEQTFENLTIYKLKDNYFRSKISLMDNVSYFILSKNNFNHPLWLSFDYVDLLSPLQINSNDLFMKYGRNLLISSENAYKYYPQKVIKENLLVEMPAAKFLPDTPLYPFIRLKEKIQYFGLPQAEKFTFKVRLAGKRLTEAYFLKEKGSSKSIIPLLNEYQKTLPQIKEDVQARTSEKKGKGELSIQFILSRHQATLNLIKEKTNSKERVVIEEALNKLVDFMRDTNVIPYHQIVEQEIQPSVDRLVSRFNLPFSGKYELLLDDRKIQNIYPDSLNKIKFQINNEVKEFTGLPSDNFISYGMLNLPQGLNEISFNSIPSANLAKFREGSIKGNIEKSDDEIEIASEQHDSNYIDIDVDPIYGGEWYQLTFDSWIKLGDKFKVQVLQDTDPYDSKQPGKKLLAYDNDFPRDIYENYWKYNVFNFYINPTTTKASIRLVVIPWNDCKDFQSKTSCLDKAVRYRYERYSDAAFKNIKAVRLLTNPVYLKAELSQGGSIPGEVNFIKKDAGSYFGKVKISKPTWIFFKESFDSGWELSLMRNKEIYKPSQHLVANLFANAWAIEETGDYDFTLSYRPQKFIQAGMLLAGLGWVIVVLMFVMGYNFQRLSKKK